MLYFQVTVCGQSGIGIEFLRVLWLSPVNYRFTVAPYSFNYHPGNTQWTFYRRQFHTGAVSPNHGRTKWM